MEAQATYRKKRTQRKNFWFSLKAEEIAGDFVVQWMQQQGTGNFLMSYATNLTEWPWARHVTEVCHFPHL